MAFQHIHKKYNDRVKFCVWCGLDYVASNCWRYHGQMVGDSHIKTSRNRSLPFARSVEFVSTQVLYMISYILKANNIISVPN